MQSVKLQVVLTSESQRNEMRWRQLSARPPQPDSWSHSFGPGSPAVPPTSSISETPDQSLVSGNQPTHAYADIGEVARFLHLARSDQTLQEVCQDVIKRFARLYPDQEPLEVSKIQDASWFDLDPDYVVHDLLYNYSTIYVLSAKPLSLSGTDAGHSAGLNGTSKRVLEAEDESNIQKKSRVSSIWMTPPIRNSPKKLLTPALPPVPAPPVFTDTVSHQLPNAQSSPAKSASKEMTPTKLLSGNNTTDLSHIIQAQSAPSSSQTSIDEPSLQIPKKRGPKPKPRPIAAEPVGKKKRGRPPKLAPQDMTAPPEEIDENVVLRPPTANGNVENARKPSEPPKLSSPSPSRAASLTLGANSISLKPPALDIEKIPEDSPQKSSINKALTKPVSKTVQNDSSSPTKALSQKSISDISSVTETNIVTSTPAKPKLKGKPKGKIIQEEKEKEVAGKLVQERPAQERIKAADKLSQEKNTKIVGESAQETVIRTAEKPAQEKINRASAVKSVKKPVATAAQAKLVLEKSTSESESPASFNSATENGSKSPVGEKDDASSSSASESESGSGSSDSDSDADSDSSSDLSSEKESKAPSSPEPATKPRVVTVPKVAKPSSQASQSSQSSQKEATARSTLQKKPAQSAPKSSDRGRSGMNLLNSSLQIFANRPTPDVKERTAASIRAESARSSQTKKAVSSSESDTDDSESDSDSSDESSNDDEVIPASRRATPVRKPAKKNSAFKSLLKDANR